MILHVESPEAANIVVFLNDKPVKHFISALDGAEGWIEVIDPMAMAPLDSIKGDPWAEVDSTADETDWTPVKTKKVYGIVEFRRLG